jgi:hypothetical protein
VSSDDALHARAQVTFAEVVGMEELNDGKPRKVKNCKVHAIAVLKLACAVLQPLDSAITPASVQHAK